VSQFPAFERLFARHKLGPVERVEPLTGGRLNSVARINDVFVLRWREPTRSTGSLKREAALLERLNGRVRTPECVASGMDENLGEYLVQRWISGQNLLEAWLTNPDVTTREWWMLQWIESIKAIHAERFPRPGELPEGRLKEYPTWRNYMESRIRKRMDGLMRIPGVDRQLVLAAERYVRREAPVLEDLADAMEGGLDGCFRPAHAVDAAAGVELRQAGEIAVQRVEGQPLPQSRHEHLRIAAL
jgi:hypothetical protein